MCLTDGDDGSLRLAERNVSANLSPVHEQHSRAPRDQLETETSETNTTNQSGVACCDGGGNVDTTPTNRASKSSRKGSGNGNVTTCASASCHRDCDVLQVGDAAAACSASEGRGGRVEGEGAAAAPDASPRMPKRYPPARELVGGGEIKDRAAPGGGALGAGFPGVDPKTPTVSAASDATVEDGSSIRVGVHCSGGGGGGDGGGNGGLEVDDRHHQLQRRKRAPAVFVRKLRWGFHCDMESCLGGGGGPWDVVLGSDIAALPYASAHGDLVRTISFLVNSGSAAALDSESTTERNAENGTEVNAENAPEVSGKNGSEVSAESTELEGEVAAQPRSACAYRGGTRGEGGGGEEPGGGGVQSEVDSVSGDESGTGLSSRPLAPLLTTSLSPPPPPPLLLPPRQPSSPPVPFGGDQRRGGEGRKVLVLLAHKHRHVCEEAFFEDLRAELGESSSCSEMGEDDVHPDFRGMGIRLLAFEVDVGPPNLSA